jgi:hypothetical protein
MQELWPRYIDLGQRAEFLCVVPTENLIQSVNGLPVGHTLAWMVPVLRFFAVLLAWLRTSQARREAEILYLRQQLIVLKRSKPARPRVKATDRLIFVCLCRLFPSLLQSSIIFKPATLLRWHRGGFRLFWRWKSRRRAGRPPLSADKLNNVDPLAWLAYVLAHLQDHSAKRIDELLPWNWPSLAQQRTAA